MSSHLFFFTSLICSCIIIASTGSSDPSARMSPLGCYSMSYPRNTYGAWIEVDYPMPNACFDRYCNGQKYVGMQDYTCFCTDIAPTDQDKIEDAKCDMKCNNSDEENPSDVLCGGKDGMSVYELKPIPS